MNARSYRVNWIPSPLDFPSIIGLGQSSVSYHSQPNLNKENVLLTITNMFVLTDMNSKKEYVVLSVQSDYEIPCNHIKSREDVFEFYIDALQSLNEAYQFAQTQLPTLPNITFPNQPIANYTGEIDRVFNLMSMQN